MLDLAPCSHRGPEAAPGVFYCGSNRPRLPEPGLAPAAFCERCPFSDLPNAAQAPAGLLSPQETEHLLPMAGCSHRGAVPIRIGTCNLCGMKRQPFKVYPCKLHGECSIRFYNRMVKPCLTCRDCTLE